MKEPVLVWAFDDAPEEFRALSLHGGDEDWLAVIPAGYDAYGFPWMDDPSPFGVCDVSEHKLPDGRRVRIGAHA